MTFNISKYLGFIGKVSIQFGKLFGFLLGKFLIQFGKLFGFLLGKFLIQLIWEYGFNCVLKYFLLCFLCRDGIGMDFGEEEKVLEAGELNQISFINFKCKSLCGLFLDTMRAVWTSHRRRNSLTGSLIRILSSHTYSLA